MQYGDEIAVTDSEKKITYLELNQKAICIGQYFMEKGICKDDKVLVQMPNRISFVAVLFALAKIRTVPIMMLPAHREAELEGIIALAKPTAYVVAERYLGFSYVEMAMNMQKKFPCIQNVFVDGVQREEWYEPETKCKKEYHPLLLEELLDLRTESEIENIFDNFSQEYIQYSVEMRKKILAQTILFYMNKKGVLLKDIPCTLNQILKCLSVNTDNNDIIYRWIELLKKYNYVTETDGIYVCKIEIYEKGLKYGWEEVEYLWKGKLESPLVLDYIINNIKNWDKLIQKEQQATLLLFEQGEDIYADALYKETKILQYLNHSLSKKVLGYLYENANATILEIGAGTGATSDKVLSDIRENKFEEHIVYFYTDISRFFLQRAKERYKECDGKIEMHYQTLDIDEAFSSQLPSNFQADIVIAVGVLNNSVNTDKCIYEINSVMKPGGILLIIETVEDVPDILITQSFMMTEPKDQRKATNTMFLNRKQWLEILEENGFCNSEEFPGYGEYLEVLGQKLFYCTKE